MSRKITSGEWDGLFAARGRARPGAEARRVERLMAEAVRTEALRVCRCFAALPEHLYDDVAQEACLRVWRRFAQCRAEQSFGAWVKTVIASVATSTLRSHGRYRRAWRDTQVTAAALGPLGPSPVDATVDARRRLVLLHGRAEALTPALRVVYDRVLLGGEDIADTAASLGVHRSVIDQRVHRVRGALAEAA
jgi:RNA polymerase sigma factor (sigma-70 family)